MALTADDYFQELKALLPQGAAWPTEDDATINQFLYALAEELARVDARADDLLNELDPRTTSEVLTDWERVMGLPDHCTELGTTLQERRNAIVAKLNAIGGQSPQYFIDLFASFGYEVTITEYRPFKAGDPCDGPCYSEEWVYWWKINAPENTIYEFKASQNSAGDSLRWWGNALLECITGRYKPAYTDVIFAYG